MFTKATKYEAKLRMAIDGPSGSGKTFTSLVIASAMAQALNTRIAVIDTERGSASKYADQFDFDVCELGSDPNDDKPFHPDRYIKAIESAKGYGILIIDSLTHAWSMKGGVLEFVDETARKKNSANKFTAWAEGTPLQNKLVDAFLGFPGHVIVTMRTKTEYAMEANEKGKQTVRKLGMAPIQRDGVEYEFDLVGDMNLDNEMIVSKSRIPALTGELIPKPDHKLATKLLAWLSGAPAPARPLPTAPPPQAPPHAGNNVAPLRVACEHCSVDITTEKAADGTTPLWRATMAKTGHKLCRDCGHKAVAAMEAAKPSAVTCQNCGAGLTVGEAEETHKITGKALCDKCFVAHEKGNGVAEIPAPTPPPAPVAPPPPPVAQAAPPPPAAPAPVPDNGKSMASLKW